MLDFKNQSLNIEHIPNFKEVQFHHVHKSYLKVLRIVYGSVLASLLIGMVTLYYLIHLPNSVFFSILIGLLMFYSAIVIEIELGFSRRKFGIRDLDLIFQKGYFVFKQTLVPYKRIQHVEIKQGPVFKIFKLYTLKVYTAGSSSGDLSIAGLGKTYADKLKTQILKVADLDGN